MRIKNLPSIESMDGSQDALVIEQTDGSEDKSRKVSPSQLKQYILNDMDEVPTQNSNNPVKSGGIYSKIGDLTQTGLTGDSVAAQLGDAREQIAGLTANTLTGIDISAYNSASNQYTAPTDGYVRMELRNANHYFYLSVNNATLLGGEGHQVTNAYDYISVFIKKGMKLYYTGTVQTAVFYSLVNG